MQKPFDVSDLKSRLLAQGLPDVEAVAEHAVDGVLAWLRESLAMESASNSLYAIGLPVIDAIKPFIDAEVKRISPPPAA